MGRQLTKLTYEPHIKNIARELDIPQYKAIFLKRLAKDAQKAQRYSAYCFEKTFKLKTEGIPTSILMAMVILYTKFGTKPIGEENNFLAVSCGNSTLNSGQKSYKKARLFRYTNSCNVPKCFFASYASRVDCLIDFVSWVSSNRKFKKCFYYKTEEDFFREFRIGLRNRWQKTIDQRLLVVMERYALRSFNLKFSEIWGGIDVAEVEYSWPCYDRKRRGKFHRTVLEKC